MLCSFLGLIELCEFKKDYVYFCNCPGDVTPTDAHDGLANPSGYGLDLPIQAVCNIVWTNYERNDTQWYDLFQEKIVVESIY